MTRLTILCLLFCIATFWKPSFAADIPEQKIDDASGEVAERQAHASSHAAASAGSGHIPLRNNGSPSMPTQFGQCYACADCPKIHYNTTTKYCPFSFDQTKLGRCVAYAEKYKYSKTPYVVRGCASERGTCADIYLAHNQGDMVKLLWCNDCEGHDCNTNGAGKTLPDFVIAILSLLVTPVVIKKVLS